MRALLQRVSQAQVTVQAETIGRIGPGLVVFLGVGPHDSADEAALLADKIVGLRIFEDEQGKMNRSILESRGSLLVVSQFTLWADCRKGRRPSFTGAAAPADAERLYEEFLRRAAALGVAVETGRFAAHMEVSLTNDGPVTIWLDTEQLQRPRRSS